MDGLLLIGGIVAIAAIIILVFVYYYNRIRILSNRIEEAWAQIDVQLKKRYDLVPNLVETVKGYAAHERGIFEKIAEARAGMVSGSREGRMEASNALTGALRSLFAVRQFYNSSVLAFNNLITTIPGAWFAGGRQKNAFLEVPEAEREPVRVAF
jgi:LemA protein